MSPASLVFILLFCFMFLLSSLSNGRETGNRSDCPAFDCGNFGLIAFPFTQRDRPDCGLCFVDGCNEKDQRIQLEKDGLRYHLSSISQAEVINLQFHDCQSLLRFRPPKLPYISLFPASNITLTSCNNKYKSVIPLAELNGKSCNNLTSLLPVCDCQQGGRHITSLHAKVPIRARLTSPCRACHYRLNGLCEMDSRRNFYCTKTKHGSRHGLKLGIGIGGSAILLILLFSISWRLYKLKHTTSFCLRGKTSNLSSRSDLEDGGVYPGVHIFSYRELEEATNNFDCKAELGDGGFGTVFYGKLKDGREVAIKRLYQHNYRRVEQFMNEVEILACLRHKNLVSLYGCTSRRSRELVLVYEYVSNGTVADHLHGDRAQATALTWPIRMSIARETASALAYLHASDVIHRDVKTSNILLDDNFGVKVADFGLSRLFPNDVTHISTAPQGTPGYVDPEYYQCYQLTDKSDVYSFGVMLIELISSMPAVDTSRHRQEVNLANLAINRIQARAVHELIDPCLWHESKETDKRMITAVAELAFQCLQQEKEIRPTMDEVLEELKRIPEMEYKSDNMEDTNRSNDEQGSLEVPSSSPCYDEDALLKSIKQPPSPISVTDKWISRSTTPNISE